LPRLRLAYPLPPLCEWDSQTSLVCF
jgi:hypothetical protein